MSNIQIIICVETNCRSKSDYMYISKLIKEFYKVGKTVKLTPVYLDGKNNYAKQNILGKINTNIKMYRKSGESKVIYFFDKDRFMTNSEDAGFIIQVEEFCKEKGFETVWFVETIEEVFIGERVSKSNKKGTSIGFFKSKKVEHLNLTHLLVKNPTKIGTSNIMIVLDNHLERN